jgi:hypothetical protein
VQQLLAVISKYVQMFGEAASHNILGIEHTKFTVRSGVRKG